MKGAVGLLELGESPVVRRIEDVGAPVSSDMVAFHAQGGEPQVALITHAGRLYTISGDSTVTLRAQLSDGAPVRSALRVWRGDDGGCSIAVLDGASRLWTIDVDSWQPRLLLHLRHAPRRLQYGAVAAPGIWSDGSAARLLVVDRSRVGVLVDPSSGQVISSWFLPYGSDSDVTIDSLGRTAFFCTGESLGATVTGVCFAIDLETGCVKWTYNLDGGVDAQPLLISFSGFNPVIALVSLADASLTVLSKDTGELLWRTRLPETGQCNHRHLRCTPVGYSQYLTQTCVCRAYAAPIGYWDEGSLTPSILVLSMSGRASAAKDGNWIGSWKLGGSVRADPVVVPDNAGSFVCHPFGGIARLDFSSGTRVTSAQDLRPASVPGLSEFATGLEINPYRFQQTLAYVGRKLQKHLRGRPPE